MKESYLKEKGLYYRINTFEQNRPTLVFIHGLSGSSSVWIPYEKIFESKYNILTYDIRGHGKSKKYPSFSDYEIKRFAEDLHNLIMHLNISKLILVSHSFGTLIALEYTRLYGEKVLAGVLLSPIFNPNKKYAKKILRQFLKLTSILNLFPFNHRKGSHIDYTKHQNTTDWDIKRILADIPNTTLRVYLHCLKQCMLPKQEYALEQIKIPILFMHGKRDTLAVSDNSIILSRKIKDSEIILLPDTDHFFMIKDVKKTSETIESFIEKNKGVFS
ncbi:MAG: alpha/beta hydrolase [Candidatus Pacebacteria bacterium]|nr:alpha/beta hydrolase [Candidatus Paceibacterota bacterium]